MATSYIEQAYGKHYLPSCTICGRHIFKGDLPMCGVAKRSTGNHVFWHRCCFEEKYGKTPEEYDEMCRAELQTELDPEQQAELDKLKRSKGMSKTESVYVLVFRDGKVWRERRDGYRTKLDGLYVCKTDKRIWKVIDGKTGLSVGNGFKTKRETEASLTDEVIAKVVKYRENSRYRAAVRANELVYARGSMPKKEYDKWRDKFAEEELEKFKQQMEPNGWKEAPKAPEPVTDERIDSLKGERVCITGTLPGMSRSEAFTRLKLAGGVPCEKFSSKVTLFVIAADAGREKREKAERAIAKGQKVRIVSGTEFVRALNEQGKKRAPKPPAKPKEDVEMKKRIEELEAELKATRKELDDVWKENANLKAKPQAPKAEQEDAAAVVSLEQMQEWCEGKGLVASQKREGACIWVEGNSKPYAEELKELGFRFAKKRKSWYYPAA